MKLRFRSTFLLGLFITSILFSRAVDAASYIAYISDSTNSSSITWIAKDAGIFKKHGLDLDTIFINGSVRGIQSMIAGDLGYSGAVGTAVINAKLAGGDVAIVQSQMNTLPYFIIGNANIKSPEGLRGRAAAVHIPGTSADFAMRLALMKVAIPYKDIKAITVGGAPARLAAVTQGQADFTVVTDGEKIQGEKLGLKVIIDMAKLNVPFQFNCIVTTRKKIRENPDEVRRVVLSMAEAVVSRNIPSMVINGSVGATWCSSVAPHTMSVMVPGDLPSTSTSRGLTTTASAIAGLVIAIRVTSNVVVTIVERPAVTDTCGI